VLLDNDEKWDDSFEFRWWIECGLLCMVAFTPCDWIKVIKGKGEVGFGLEISWTLQYQRNFKNIALEKREMAI